MTVAKQGLLLCEMIERGWVQAVVATGALMTHGLTEGAGLLHFQHRTGMQDEDLYKRGYNRVYDTIELEKNLDDVEQILQRALSRRRAREHDAFEPHDLRTPRPTICRSTARPRES